MKGFIILTVLVFFQPLYASINYQCQGQKYNALNFSITNKKFNLNTQISTFAGLIYPGEYDVHVYRDINEQGSNVLMAYNLMGDLYSGTDLSILFYAHFIYEQVSDEFPAQLKLYYSKSSSTKVMTIYIKPVLCSKLM